MIHEHPRFEKTPIIFITGVHVSELDRLQGYKLGAVDYVSIPVVPEILRSKVAVLVELYCQRRELQQLNRSLAEANASAGAGATRPCRPRRTRELEDSSMRHCARPTATRMSSWRCWRTSCAIRWRRSTTPCS